MMKSIFLRKPVFLLKSPALLIPILLSCFSWAQTDEVSIDSKITGNQEQPNVLSIVPWKNADDLSVIEKGYDEEIDQIFPHLEPTEFQRRRLFSEQLTEN